MPKISDLISLTTPNNDDVLPIVDIAGVVTKKIKRSDLLKGTPLPNNTVTTPAITDASVTAAKTAFGGDYSTSEVDTGFKWVDNKTIFKKTISTGALPNSTSKSVAHGISTFDFAIHTYGHAKNSGGVIRPLPYPGTSTNYFCISVDATNIMLSTSSDLTTYSVSYVTLIYVKT